jgi:hypothetical protein
MQAGYGGVGAEPEGETLALVEKERRAHLSGDFFGGGILADSALAEFSAWRTGVTNFGVSIKEGGAVLPYRAYPGLSPQLFCAEFLENSFCNARPTEKAFPMLAARGRLRLFYSLLSKELLEPRLEADTELRDRTGRDLVLFCDFTGRHPCRQIAGQFLLPMSQRREKVGHIQTEGHLIQHRRVATDEPVQVRLLEGDTASVPTVEGDLRSRLALNRSA